MLSIKRKQKSYKTYKYKKDLKYFMKSRSNSSNKDEKQEFEAKTVIDIKILFTGNVLRPVFTETELQINRKTF